MMELMPFKKKKKGKLCVSPPCEDTPRKWPLKARKRATPEPTRPGSNLRLPAPTTIRNKFLLCELPSLRFFVIAA